MSHGRIDRIRSRRLNPRTSVEFARKKKEFISSVRATWADKPRLESVPIQLWFTRAPFLQSAGETPVILDPEWKTRDIGWPRACASERRKSIAPNDPGEVGICRGSRALFRGLMAIGRFNPRGINERAYASSVRALLSSWPKYKRPREKRASRKASGVIRTSCAAFLAPTFPLLVANVTAVSSFE